MADPFIDSSMSPDAGMISRRSTLRGGAPLALPKLPYAKPAPRPEMPDKEWSGDRDELLLDLVRKFETAEMATTTARQLAERDRDYYDGKQWTAEQIKVLRDRGQPVITDNFIKEKVNYQLGSERRIRSDPKAYPRTPAQEDKADAATQVLRYVADDNVFNRVRSDVFANIVIEGVGGCEVVVEEDGDDGYDVRIHRISYDRLWWDPYSADADFHDARYLGTVLWGDRVQFLDLFPGKTDVLETTLGPQQGWGTEFDDKPSSVWVDTKRSRVRIVTCHWQERGDWWTAVYTRGGFLHGPIVSPYVDRRGQTCCPLILRSANVDRENNRYGLIRDLISLQDEVNARRSKLMHLLNTRQVIAEEGAVEDEDKAREELAKADGWVNKRPNFQFEVSRDTEMSRGQFELLAHTIGRLQGHGPNASMTGKDPRELSGRAISLQQAGGAVEQEPDLDGLRLWSRRVYEHVWMRARQYWDDARAIRVLDTPDKFKFITINRPVTFGEALSRLPSAEQAFQVRRYMIQPNDARLQKVVGYENDIGDLDMEITVEEGADTPTMAFEQFNQLMQFAQANPGAIPVEVLIQASALKNKAQLVEQIEQHQKEQAQAAAAQQQLQHAMATAKLAETQAKAASLQAGAQDKRAQAVERIHGVAVDHAQTTQPQTSVSVEHGPFDPALMGQPTQQGMMQ